MSPAGWPAGSLPSLTSSSDPLSRGCRSAAAASFACAPASPSASPRAARPTLPCSAAGASGARLRSDANRRVDARAASTRARTNADSRGPSVTLPPSTIPSSASSGSPPLAASPSSPPLAFANNASAMATFITGGYAAAADARAPPRPCRGRPVRARSRRARTPLTPALRRARAHPPSTPAWYTCVSARQTRTGRWSPSPPRPSRSVAHTREQPQRRVVLEARPPRRAVLVAAVGRVFDHPSRARCGRCIGELRHKRRERVVLGHVTPPPRRHWPDALRFRPAAQLWHVDARHGEGRARRRREDRVEVPLAHSAVLLPLPPGA
eukprot:5529981-Pleurochrysis_carterae.AAC.1